MGAALNNLLIEENLEPFPLTTIRPLVSQGGLVLTRLGFAGKVPDAEIEPLRLRYLDHYHAIVADESRLVNGYSEILDELEARSIPWGIVTNKPEWLTTPLLQKMSLDKRAAVVICGDSLEHRKPHPLPLIVAAETIGVARECCIYIGDDKRDIDAGKAANMKTLIAAWGYIKPETNLDEWQAEGIVERPLDLLSHPFIN